MTRRKHTVHREAAADGVGSARATATRLNVALFLATVGVALAFAWLTRHETNPDGAAYLDLARALRDGRVGAFVQGYWSPLYPAVLAGLSPSIAMAHALNAAVIALAALVLYGALRPLVDGSAGDPTVTTRVAGAWGAFMVAAFALVRISAVTPDAMLLCCIVGWAVALTRTPPRWLHAGVWLGFGFLAKTSLWPWMLASLPVLLWREPTFRSRRALVMYCTPALALVLAWVVPLSVQAGRPAAGVTGALNACWYLRDCDGQSPDTHTGDHRAYRHVDVPGGATLRWVPLDSAVTYQPWSDPARWASGVVSQRSTPLSITRYVGVVANNLWQAMRFSLSYLIMGVVLAMGLWWWTGPSRVGAGRLRISMLVAGMLGILQFVAVQAVTRTLAPFVFLVGWSFTGPAPGGSRVAGARWKPRLLPWLPLVVAAAAILRVWSYERSLEALSAPYAAEMRELNARASGGFPRRTVVVVGRALPLMALASQLDARIVGQVPPEAAVTLNALPLAARRDLLRQMSGGRADVAWELDASAQVRVLGLR